MTVYLLNFLVHLSAFWNQEKFTVEVYNQLTSLNMLAVEKFKCIAQQINVQYSSFINKCNIITLLFIIRMNISEDSTLPIPGRWSCMPLLVILVSLFHYLCQSVFHYQFCSILHLIQTVLSEDTTYKSSEEILVCRCTCCLTVSSTTEEGFPPQPLHPLKIMTRTCKASLRAAMSPLHPCTTVSALLTSNKYLWSSFYMYRA